jgi:hypothetical protein
MSQSKKASFLEAVTNTLVGLAIAFAAQWLICWVYGIKLTAHDNAIIVFWMTVLSIFRSYVLRRIFNRQTDQVSCG